MSTQEVCLTGRFSLQKLLYIYFHILFACLGYFSYKAVRYLQLLFVYNITSCTQSRLMTDGSSAVSGRDRQMPWMTRETSRRLNR